MLVKFEQNCKFQSIQDFELLDKSGFFKITFGATLADVLLLKQLLNAKLLILRLPSFNFVSKITKIRLKVASNMADPISYKRSDSSCNKMILDKIHANKQKCCTWIQHCWLGSVHTGIALRYDTDSFLQQVSEICCIPRIKIYLALLGHHNAVTQELVRQVQ